jgi:bacteriorhodopsin
MLVHIFIEIWSTLRSFGIFYEKLEYFMVLWCIFSVCWYFVLEKSGNPATVACFFILILRHFLPVVKPGDPFPSLLTEETKRVELF